MYSELLKMNCDCFFFAVGVPNAPVASITMNILSWDVPRSNGRPILHYVVQFE